MADCGIAGSSSFDHTRKGTISGFGDDRKTDGMSGTGSDEKPHGKGTVAHDNLGRRIAPTTLRLPLEPNVFVIMPIRWGE
jgi:hypothetical protein